VRYAKKNAALAGLQNASFAAQPTGTWITQRGRGLRAVDLVVVDPPRSGLDEQTRAGLVHMKPARVVYVSCDPATLSRDLAIMINAGYMLDGPITVLDMFPQTHHVELVAKLQRQPPHAGEPAIEPEV
jgi:23S rRNA (uracil1939-C5)-methyltransferase